MNILALDQAARTSGYSIWINDKLFKNGTFTIDSTKSMDKRLKDFYNHIDSLAKEQNLDYIVFENIQLQGNVNNVETFKTLAYVQAIVLLYCGNNNIPYLCLAPSHWRKVLGGKFGRSRDEQKKSAKKYVKDNFNLEVSSDAADAICIGKAGLEELKIQNSIAFGTK